jgi:hypothetical protein
MTTSAKLAVALGIALLLALAGVAVCRSELVAERAAHSATRTKYASEKAWWLYDQRSSNGTISGLSVQASGLLRNREADRAADADLFNIFAGPGTLLDPDCGKSNASGPQPAANAAATEVVDDNTNKAAVRHINGAFARVGVRGQGN